MAITITTEHKSRQGAGTGARAGGDSTTFAPTHLEWLPSLEDYAQGADDEDTRLPSWPNATNARNLFMSSLEGVGTESFESFAAGTEPADWRVSYHYGFAGDLGGGAYRRDERPAGDAPVRTVGDTAASGFATLAAALDDWNGSGSTVIEVQDNRTYAETLGPLTVAAGASLEIRAADEQRPVLVLGGELTVTGQEDSAFVLDGLLVTGAGLRLGGELDRIHIRHTTLHPATVPLTVDSGEAEVVVERSILGPVAAAPECRATLVDSILDAGSAAAPAWTGGILSLSQVTVAGTVGVQELPLAENSIFLGPVVAQRRQQGCVRFSHVPRGSRVPRRHRCQPVIPEGATAAEAVRQAARVRPRFTSLTFGEPGYCQLAGRHPEEIFRGAEDGSEMGAFSFLRQPQRLARLEARLVEYLPLGLESGVFLVT